MAKALKHCRLDRYVMKLVKNFDEEFKNMASGMNMRPTTREEVRTHLESFGLIGDVIDNKVRRLSGGQVSIELQHDGTACFRWYRFQLMMRCLTHVQR